MNGDMREPVDRRRSRVEPQCHRFEPAERRQRCSLGTPLRRGFSGRTVCGLLPARGAANMEKFWQHADNTAIIGVLIGIIVVVGGLIYYVVRREFPIRRLWTRFAPTNPEEVPSRMSPTLPLPPPRLRARVSGIDDTDLFLRVGKNSIEDMRRSLAEISRSFGSFSRILDFGCGCGRTIRWFEPSVSELYGCDIDEEAILWCQDNLSFARFLRNAMRPPLPYQDGQFDFVYSISIFTHLREDYQRLWFAECARVMAPGGIFLFTINNKESWPPDSVEEVRSTGIKFYPPGDNEFWPDWYGTAYLDLDKLSNFTGQQFEFVYHAAKGLNGHQDIVIARRM